MFKTSPLVLLAFASLPLFAAEGDAPSTKEVMKEYKYFIENRIADIDYKRKQVVEHNMGLSVEQGEKFWPVYNTYRTEVDKLSKDAVALLLDYSREYDQGSVSDDSRNNFV